MLDAAHNIAELKNGNRHQILDCLRYAPMSRAELSRRIGLAKSSVTTLTNEMIRQGLLEEAGLAEKNNKAGRTQILLNIHGSYAFAVGIHLHRKLVSVTAVNLMGKTLFEFSESTATFSDTEQVLSYIREHLLRGVEEAGLSLDRLVGIGVSSPGPLDHKNGVILEPPKFPFFRNYPIVKRLTEAYGCPVFLENNAVALALYEHYYVKAQAGCSLFVTISEGVGSALLQNGEVYRGSHGIAAELGHISVNPEGEPCPCGNCGCLELYAPLSAMKRRFGFASYPAVIDAAIRGEGEEQQILAFLVQKIGAALATAVNLFDLDRIILYGEYAYRAEHLVTMLDQYLVVHSAIYRAHPVSLVVSGQKESDASAAAAVSALNYFYKNNTVARCKMKLQ